MKQQNRQLNRRGRLNKRRCDQREENLPQKSRARILCSFQTENGNKNPIFIYYIVIL